MKRILMLFFVLACCANQLNAQVGINTLSPDTSSILHIYGGGTKGLLIPEMDNERRRTKAQNEYLAKGLLVYDSEQKMYFFYNGSEWIALNPLQSTDTFKNTVKLSTGHNTMTFSNNMIVIGTIDITGTAKFQSEVTMNTSLTTLNSGATTLNNPVTINNALTTQNINATNYTIDAKTVNATNGYGIVPIGGIIMWSGTTAPDGWALCDGTNGTPNLKGRFIVGAGQYSSTLSRESLKTYDYKIKDTGGLNNYALSVPEMPKHTHDGENTDVNESDGGTQWYDNPEGTMNTYGYRTWVKEGGYGLVQRTRGVAREGGSLTFSNLYKNDKSKWDGGFTVGARDGASRGYEPNVLNPPVRMLFAGENQPHENRPPYYVLAFIMRVK